MFLIVAASVLQRRLIFVTGKGGVGKTTVALALGLRAARSGRRTIVADLGGEGDLRETELAPNLFRISVDPQSAMEEYLNVKVPGPAGQALRQSRLFSAFAMATPGMREMLCIGKLWELAQFERRTQDADAYDLVIVDAPASGHGAAILRTPRMFAEIAKVGPIAHQARTIAATIADREFTAVMAVSTPEEMPVNETLELRGVLAASPDPLELEAVILNARYPDRFTPADVAALNGALDSEPAPTPAGRAAIVAALAEHRRARLQDEQEQRLRSSFAERLRVLPYLFEPTIGIPQLERLAAELAT
jgi:anion-transporting  ArsA/GET3 family ATPase